MEIHESAMYADLGDPRSRDSDSEAQVPGENSHFCVKKFYSIITRKQLGVET